MRKNGKISTTHIGFVSITTIPQLTYIRVAESSFLRYWLLKTLLSILVKLYASLPADMAFYLFYFKKFSTYEQVKCW